MWKNKRIILGFDIELYIFVFVQSTDMNKVIINIDWVPNNFCAAPEAEGIACVATGKTLEEAERNIVEALSFHIDGLREDGERVPDAFQAEWEPEFHLSTRAQLKYVDGYIVRKSLAREIGVAEQQLSHYANGQRHPRPEMQRRITEGIKSICARLSCL